MQNLYMEKLTIFFLLISCWFSPPRTKMNASQWHRRKRVKCHNIKWVTSQKQSSEVDDHKCCKKNETVLLFFFSLSIKSNRDNDQPLKVFTSQVTDLHRKINVDIWLAGHTLITHLFMSRLCVCYSLKVKYQRWFTDKGADSLSAFGTSWNHNWTIWSCNRK